MKAEYHSAASVSGSWYCSSWLLLNVLRCLGNSKHFKEHCLTRGIKQDPGLSELNQNLSLSLARTKCFNAQNLLHPLSFFSLILRFCTLIRPNRMFQRFKGTQKLHCLTNVYIQKHINRIYMYFVDDGTGI